MISLSSACQQFTETAEQVFILIKCALLSHIILTLLHHRYSYDFNHDKVVSVLKKRKVEADEKERKVFINKVFYVRLLSLKKVELILAVSKLCRDEDQDGLNLRD